MDQTNVSAAYAYHFEFLKDFAELNDWLNVNGFSVIHSHQDFKMRMVYSYWADHSSECDESYSDARNCLMITYCMKCKTVEVFRRMVITKDNQDKSLIQRLNSLCETADAFHSDCNECEKEGEEFPFNDTGYD